MKTILLLLVIFVVVVVLANPGLRSRVFGWVRRQVVRSKGRVGATSARDLQKLTLSQIRESSQELSGGVYLPTDVTVILNPADVSGLDDLQDRFLEEIASHMKTMVGKSAGAKLKYKMEVDRPSLRIESGATVPVGEVRIRGYFINQTVEAFGQDGSEKAEHEATVDQSETVVLTRNGTVSLEVEEDGKVTAKHQVGLPAKLGRGSHNDVAVGHTNQVSRRHCELSPGPEDTLQVTDTSSTSGVRIDSLDADPIVPGVPTQVEAGQTLFLCSSVKVVITGFDPQGDTD